jgi:hypothetical protein
MKKIYEKWLVLYLKTPPIPELLVFQMNNHQLSILKLLTKVLFKPYLLNLAHGLT